MIKIGCDYFADEDGEFELRFYDYETGEEIGIYVFKGNPKHRISRDIFKGEVR